MAKQILRGVYAERSEVLRMTKKLLTHNLQLK